MKKWLFAQIDIVTGAEKQKKKKKNKDNGTRLNLFKFSSLKNSRNLHLLVIFTEYTTHHKVTEKLLSSDSFNFGIPTAP